MHKAYLLKYLNINFIVIVLVESKYKHSFDKSAPTENISMGIGRRAKEAVAPWIFICLHFYVSTTVNRLRI